MRDRIKKAINELLDKKEIDKKIASDFLDRIKDENLTIDTDPKSHFCAYFAPYDPIAKKVFLGHHKKSGLWLFNGGHLDEGENLEQSLAREIDEEWGLSMKDFDIKKLEMFTITPIYNPEKQPCRMHYDLWNFIEISMDNFKPDKGKLSEEFYEAGWKNLDEARELMGDNNSQTLKAINFIEKKYFK